MKKLLIFLLIFTFVFSAIAEPVLAKGVSSGRGSSFSSSRSTSSKSYATKPKTAAQVKAEKAAAQKQAAAKAQEQKYQSASSKLPTTKTKSGRTYTKGQTIGVNGYQPRFNNGYQAPAGSTVYYNNGFSAWDWIPLWYIMNHDGNQNVVVHQPDGKEVQVKEEGSDGMYVFNWILTIILGLGFIGLVIYLVNKYTTKRGGERNYATY